MRKRCRCGKIIFTSKLEAQVEADYQLSKTEIEYRVYDCTYGKDIWHLTTKNYLKSTQLILGGLDKNRTLEVVLPGNRRYLVIRKDKTIPKLAFQLFDDISIIPKTEEDFKRIIWTIAKTGKDGNWISPEPWILQEMKKHKHRPFNVLSEFSRVSGIGQHNQAAFLVYVEEITKSLEGRFNIFTSIDSNIRKSLLGMGENEEFVMDTPPVVKKEIVIVPEEKLKKDKIRRKFVALHKDGLDAWDRIAESGVDVSDIVERFLLLYVKREL